MLNLVVAHELEARPLIRLLGLQRLQEKPFKLYGNAQAGTDATRLIISGMGQLQSATAVGFLAASEFGAGESKTGACPAWLNIGIAGHGAAELGSAHVVNAITEARSGARAYPVPMLTAHSSTELITVDSPETEYGQPSAYDMEGFAFFQAASRFATLELVQLFKIVSDNPGHAAYKVEVNKVPSLIEACSGQILELTRACGELARQASAPGQLPDACRELQQRLHFSATERHHLQRLCQRCVALGVEDELESLLRQRFARGSEALQALEQILQQAEVH